MEAEEEVVVVQPLLLLLRLHQLPQLREEERVQLVLQALVPLQDPVVRLDREPLLDLAALLDLVAPQQHQEDHRDHHDLQVPHLLEEGLLGHQVRPLVLQLHQVLPALLVLAGKVHI